MPFIDMWVCVACHWACYDGIKR